MRIDELQGKRLVIWGAGREGTAAAAFLRQRLPNLDLVFIDEGELDSVRVGKEDFPVLRASEATLATADVVIKSPGVSLYHPLLEKEKKRGLRVTSLLNLWRAENPGAFVIAVTGTKGKSTTSTLLGHVLSKLGKKAEVLGNIGRPVSEAREGEADYFILELSSYQTASFDGHVQMALMTSLFPEHLNWHGSLHTYYADKARLLAQADRCFVSAQAADVLRENKIGSCACVLFDDEETRRLAGNVENAFLLREHNRSNVAAVLAMARALGFDPAAALAAMADYRGLPHRQQECGVKDGVLYVDDSISTTPQSTLAALDAFAEKPVGLIVGGYDRGLDYAPLIARLTEKPCAAVLCLGQSGARLFAALTEKNLPNVARVSSMEEAVAKAQALTPPGGVILLSPAAPSFDMFKDYTARAEAFIQAAGQLSS